MTPDPDKDKQVSGSEYEFPWEDESIPENLRDAAKDDMEDNPEIVSSVSEFFESDDDVPPLSDSGKYGGLASRKL